MIENKRIEFDNVIEGESYRSCTFSFSKNTLRISDVIFDNCIFDQADFSNSEWLDCELKRCDFSNNHFENSVFYRTKIKHCNLVGADFSNNLWKDTTISESRADYINFSGSKLTKCRIENSSLIEAYFQEVVFNGGLNTNDCDFNKSNFWNSKLKKVNLANSNFEVLDVNPTDLKGLIINQYQAVKIVQLFGVTVE